MQRVRQESVTENHSFSKSHSQSPDGLSSCGSRYHVTNRKESYFWFYGGELPVQEGICIILSDQDVTMLYGHSQSAFHSLQGKNKLLEVRIIYVIVNKKLRQFIYLTLKCQN